MRRIITHIATSADGFIARPDGSVDWLDRPTPKAVGDYGMRAFYRTIDTILWGRKTYDLALRFQAEGLMAEAFDRKLRHYAFSRTPPRDPAPGVTFVTEPVPAFAKRLKAERGKDVWMMGGGEIIGAFLDAGAIDAFVMHVIPVFIGEGIPLIAPRHLNIPLTLKSTKKYVDGVVRLHYELGKGASARRRKR